MREKRITQSERGMTVTTIAFPDQLYRRLKIAALDERRPAVDLVRQAVEEFLDFRHIPGRVTKRRAKGRSTL